MPEGPARQRTSPPKSGAKSIATDYWNERGRVAVKKIQERICLRNTAEYHIRSDGLRLLPIAPPRRRKKDSATATTPG